MDNAIKFTKKGHIRIKIGVYKNALQIVVSDTGIGIPKESKNEIFEKSKQLSTGLERHYEGIGLGLTIVKNYIDLLNGKISIDSVVDQGTTITVDIELPKKKPVADVPKQAKTIAIKDTKIPSVLLVEDNPLNLKVMQIMSKGKIEIDAVPSAELALEAVQIKDYDFLLIDINLGPGINGVDLMIELRKIPNYKNKPMAAVTAYAMHGDREMFIKKGFNHYLAKPFNKDQMHNLIQLMSDEI